MRTQRKALRMMRAAIFAFALTVAALDVFGLGKDYSNHEPVTDTQWPGGMSRLVNTTNRVHGYLFNASDSFFFSGSATNLTAFLENYSAIQGIEKHCLILHDGKGEAKSPWSTNSQSCDWKLYGCPKGWQNLSKMPEGSSVDELKKAASSRGYVLEVHFWTGGHIALDQVSIPKNIEIRNDVKP